MNALLVLLLVVTIYHSLMYHPGFYKYYLAFLIPYYLVTQIFFGSFKLNTSKKKFFMSTWSHPYDSQIYCQSTINMTSLLEYLKKYNEKKHKKIGVTVFLLKLCANLFIKYPKLNGNILFGNFYYKKQVDISVMIANEGQQNTEVITVKDANKLSLEEIKDSIDERIERINKGLDVNINRKKFFLNILPTFLLSPFLRIMSHLSCSGFSFSLLGLPKYYYGTAVICNYGKLGLEDTFLPISPFSNSPFNVGVSKIKESFDEEGKVMKKCKFCFTIDHRFLDGAIASRLLDDIKEAISNPEIINDPSYFVEKKNV